MIGKIILLLVVGGIIHLAVTKLLSTYLKDKNFYDESWVLTKKEKKILADAIRPSNGKSRTVAARGMLFVASIASMGGAALSLAGGYPVSAGAFVISWALFLAAGSGAPRSYLGVLAGGTAGAFAGFGFEEGTLAIVEVIGMIVMGAGGGVLGYLAVDGKPDAESIIAKRMIESARSIKEKNLKKEAIKLVAMVLGDTRHRTMARGWRVILTETLEEINQGIIDAEHTNMVRKGMIEMRKALEKENLKSGLIAGEHAIAGFETMRDQARGWSRKEEEKN